MPNESINCPLCGKVSATRLNLLNHKIHEIDCKRCGNFSMDLVLFTCAMKHNTGIPDDRKHLLSGFVREQTDLQGERLLLTQEVIGSCENRLPHHPKQKAERLLSALVRVSGSFGTCLKIKNDEWLSRAYATDPDELVALLACLAGEGLIRRQTTDTPGLSYAWVEMKGVTESERLTRGEGKRGKEFDDPLPLDSETVAEMLRATETPQSTGAEKGPPGLLNDQRAVDLLIRLWSTEDREAGIAILDLPEPLRDEALLTACEFNKWIEFGRRNHCHHGGGPHRQLILEDGWSFVSLDKPNKKRTGHLLREALTEQVESEIRHRVRLTYHGEGLASQMMPPRIQRSPSTKSEGAAGAFNIVESQHSLGGTTLVHDFEGPSKRFRVAFSFSGTKRDFIAKVAQILAARFGEEGILYDKFHQAEFARHDLVFLLPDLYHDQSDLIVVVVCPNYEKKEWCGLEWDATFDLLKQRQNDAVMLCRFEHATVKGLYSTAGFVELDDKTPDEAATFILQRLARNEGLTRDHYLTGSLAPLSHGDQADNPPREAKPTDARPVPRKEITDPPPDSDPSEFQNRIEQWKASLSEQELSTFETECACNPIKIGDPPETWPPLIRKMLSESQKSPDEVKLLFADLIKPARAEVGRLVFQVYKSTENAVESIREALLDEHIARSTARLRGIDFDNLSVPEQVNFRFLLSNDPSLNGTPWAGKPVTKERGIPLGGILSGISIVDLRVQDSDRGYQVLVTLKQMLNGTQQTMTVFPAPRWLVPNDPKRTVMDDTFNVDFNPPTTDSGKPVESQPLCKANSMTPNSDGLHSIANTDESDRQADIVFIHGLGGASHSTWGNCEEGRFYWPRELGKARPDCGIWTIGYPAGFTALGKPGMIIEKRAGNISQKLANAGLGTRPLIFITHSMGGLIVKALIVDSQILADSDRKRLVSMFRGIVFCATPHRGSAFADAAGVLGTFFEGETAPCGRDAGQCRATRYPS